MDKKKLKSESHKKWRFKRKLIVLEHYGNSKCSCCGESIVQFLCIDHIDGGGAKHKKEVGRKGSDYYSWLINNNFPEGYQVLCHNCNQGRELIEGRKCPHTL